jgi:magnesium-transporting ATPase (P-type)
MNNTHRISALPKGWPNPTEADFASQPKRVVKICNSDDQDYVFCNNSIKTYKYEIWDFLPKFLLEEFNPRTKVANCYFLLISGMQCIPAISNTGGYPTVLIPLTFVLLIAGLFKAIEDIARHKADTKANASVTEKFCSVTNDFKKVTWAEIKVGDYIRVNSRQIVPADVICMQVSEPNPELPKGMCYVETKSLDGETNLKMRQVVPVLLGKVN